MEQRKHWEVVVGDKRSTKQQQRKRRQDSEQRARDRREQRLGAPLEALEAQARLAQIDAYFDHYWQHPDPDQFLDIMASIEALNLLRLETHRHGIGAAVASVYRQHPDRQQLWVARFVGPVNSALRLCPDPEDGRWPITQPIHADQAIVQFLVTGEERFLDAIWATATADEDPCADHAAEILGIYNGLVPEVEAYLMARHPKATATQATQQAMHQREVDLATQIMNLPDAHRVAFVAWRPDEQSIVIGTMDGGTLPGVPDTFEGTAVAVRQATRRERDAYRDWQLRRDAPI